MKEFLSFIAMAIGRIWDFATRMLTISVLAAIVFAVLTILMPDNVMRAVEFVKSFLG